MLYRFFCVLMGYLWGSILTAELVTRCVAGKRAAEVGNGNPGMANVMSALGFRAGAAVLAGDLLKTVAACLMCAALFPSLGQIGVYYAGLGACLGHNFPLWNHGKGGKGVAVTCMALVMAAPLWGIAADVAGMLVVFSTGYLPVGAVVIPAVFLLPAFLVLGPEFGALTILMTLLMVSRHYRGIGRVVRGLEPRKMRLFAHKQS